MERRWLETCALLAGMGALIAFPVAVLMGAGLKSVALLIASLIWFCVARVWRWEPQNPGSPHW